MMAPIRNRIANLKAEALDYSPDIVKAQHALPSSSPRLIKPAKPRKFAATLAVPAGKAKLTIEQLPFAWLKLLAKPTKLPPDTDSWVETPDSMAI